MSKPEYLDAQDLVKAIVAMAAAVTASRELLSELDSAVGDGDHGMNLSIALSAAAEKVQSLMFPTPAEVLRQAGKVVRDSMGGAAGSVFGAFFRGCSRSIQGREKINAADIGLMLEAGLRSIQERGQAAPGDKTVVDAVYPAVVAYELALAGKQTLGQALSTAAQAAHAGAEKTQDMIAGFGRAKYLGKRSLGHQDAGATSAAIMLTAWAELVGGSHG